MRRAFTKAILFTQRNMTLALTFLIFALLWDAALVSESGSGGWTLAGAASGAAAGGYMGSIIGGIGVVAMGSGVGIPVAAVIGIGALAGGAVGGGVGAGAKALLSGEVIDFAVLAMVFCMALGASQIIIYTMKTARGLFRAKHRK